MFVIGDDKRTESERLAFNLRYMQQEYSNKYWWTYVCNDCGAVIQNTEIHDNYHDEVALAMRKASRLDVIG